MSLALDLASTTTTSMLVPLTNQFVLVRPERSRGMQFEDHRMDNDKVRALQ